MLSTGNELEYTSPELQEWGVDRICISEVGGLPYRISLQYAVQYRASETGNFFIETQIRSPYGKITPGWLRNTVAQTILFYLPASQRMIFVDANDFREWIFVYGRQLKNIDWREGKFGWAVKGLLFPTSIGKANLRSWIEMDMRERRRC